MIANNSGCGCPDCKGNCEHGDLARLFEFGKWNIYLCFECSVKLSLQLASAWPAIETQVVQGACEECGANLYHVDSGSCGHCAFGG